MSLLSDRVSVERILPRVGAPGHHPDDVFSISLLRSSRNPLGAKFAESPFYEVGWQELFDTHELLRNVRETKKVEVSAQADGALAVADTDTLWRDPAGGEVRWKGRMCKVYSRVGEEWKMTVHTGVLVYP